MFLRKIGVFDRARVCVTYSVQFKVPLFLLSAGVGSHRGAVQPLHCRGSNCRGRQCEKSVNIQAPCISDGPRVRRSIFLHLVTTPNKCHKIRCPQQYEWDHRQKHFSHTTYIVTLWRKKAMNHALKGSFEFWVDNISSKIFCTVDVTDQGAQKRDRGTQRERLLHWEHLVRGEHWLKSVQSDDLQACITTCVV